MIFARIGFPPHPANEACFNQKDYRLYSDSKGTWNVSIYLNLLTLSVKSYKTKSATQGLPAKGGKDRCNNIITKWNRNCKKKKKKKSLADAFVSTGGREMAFSHISEYIEWQLSNCDKIAWATFLRSTEDTKENDMIWMIAQH